MSVSPSRPRKILHVAPFALAPKGAGFMSVHYKLSAGLIRAGHRVVNFSDRDVARAATLVGARKLGTRSANRKLLALVEAFRPEIVLVGHADVITGDTLAEIRARLPGVVMAQWNVDPLFDDANVNRIINRMPYVEHSFVTTAGSMLDTLKPFGPASFMPNPVDPSIEAGRAFDHARLPHDVFFAVGSAATKRRHCGIETSAGDILARMALRLPKAGFALLGVHGTPVSGAECEALLQSSAIGLNISRRNDVLLYSSDRMAQLAGNGLVVMIDRATGYGELFSENELGFYSTEDELFDKVGVFLAEPSRRMAVARAGWQAYHSMFDCTRVADFVVGTIESRIDPVTFDWRR